MFLQNFVQSQPLIGIILFSFIITFALTLAYKYLINQQKMKDMKARTKELQEKMKNEKDTAKLADIQKEMLQMSMEQMKLTMKPMLITFLPLILVYGGLRTVYTAAGTGDIINWGANLPLVGTGAGWLLSYIIFSFIFNIILRKVLKVQ